MHPILIAFLLVVLVALLLSVSMLVRQGWSGDGEQAGARRMLVMAVALITAFNLVFSGAALYLAQRAGDRAGDSALVTQKQAVARLTEAVADLQQRLSVIESSASPERSAALNGFRIDPNIRTAIVRASPGGEALQRLSGGTGIEVQFCRDERDAGQYWCEIRTVNGATGWIPRPLIDPPPVSAADNPAR